MHTKEKLMKSAFQIFAKKGPEFSLSEVAKEVGIKKASIYAHFKSKDDLLHSVIEREIEEYFFKMNGEIQKLSDNEEIVEKALEKSFSIILDYYDSSDKIYFWKRVFLLPPEGFEVELMDKINYLTNQRFYIIKNIILKGMKDGIIKSAPVDSVVLAFFSAIHGMLSSVAIYNEEDLLSNYKGIWEIYWRGIRN
ncbi:TetR/AcrR family transcriptional regulator [Clostridium malenominatum]|uniref:TetR/AcrR family transcriptional regulator n=1 Tax=Clostridium malenominatum TaxID=1539 RepID=A0ABP3UE28_9CLOT